MLKFIEKRSLSTSDVFVYEGYGYRMEARIWRKNGNVEIGVEALGNPLYTPSVEVIDGEGVFSLNVGYVKPENAYKVIEGINNAVRFCEAVKELHIQ